MIFRILEDQLAQKAREKDIDRRFMELALTLGRRGLGRTWPNPAVGAVVVKDGVIVGRGWTQAGGRPHAEPVALAQAGEAARRKASGSAWGRPPGWVQPRPTMTPSFTTTAPTAGFGQVRPSPRRPWLSASRMKRRSASLLASDFSRI